MYSFMTSFFSFNHMLYKSTQMYWTILSLWGLLACFWFSAFTNSSIVNFLSTSPTAHAQDFPQGGPETHCPQAEENPLLVFYGLGDKKGFHVFKWMRGIKEEKHLMIHKNNTAFQFSVHKYRLIEAQLGSLIICHLWLLFSNVDRGKSVHQRLVRPAKPTIWIDCRIFHLKWKFGSSLKEESFQ